jgi:multicomponent Na+:H+ antiporter subunit B
MNDLILNLVARHIIPFILVYAGYITTHGHLSPGGGFAGGTVAAAAMILAVLVFGLEATGLCNREDMLCGAEAAALAGYVGVGAVAWAVGRPFLTNLAAGWPPGSAGALLSSGAVFALGAVIGLKVAATITGVYTRLGDIGDAPQGRDAHQAEAAAHKGHPAASGDGPPGPRHG